MVSALGRPKAFAAWKRRHACIRRSSASVWRCVSLADICLVPQMFNARRFDTDLSAFPTLVAISTHLESLPAFAAARPGSSAGRGERSRSDPHAGSSGSDSRPKMASRSAIAARIVAPMDDILGLDRARSIAPASVAIRASTANSSSQ